nr:MFS transporter [Pseudoclavibacter chungangensis]
MRLSSEAIAANAVSVSPRLPVLPLVAIAFATFISVTIEMLPTGLMHLMAPDLGVSNAMIGLLMSVFAFTVALTSTPLTHLTRRLPRHTMLIVVLGLFALGSIGTAVAHTYPLVLATRIFTGLAHGLFWAVVASYTALIVPKQLLTKGVSITLGGGSAAFVLGVPIGTFLGQLFGWRLTFGVLAGLTLAVVVVLWLVLPRVDRNDVRLQTAPIEVPTTLTGSINVGEVMRPVPTGPRRSFGAVLLVCALAWVTMTAQYAAYSYITPFVLDVVHVPEQYLSLVLFGYGVASAAGTLTTGILFGGRPRIGMSVTFVLLLLGVGIIAIAPSLWIAISAIAVWGVAMGFMPTLMQTRLLLAAPRNIRDVSAALYTSSFNLGIGGGALIGGVLLEHFGIGVLMPFFLVVVAIAFAGSLVIDAVQVRAARAATRDH